MKRKLLLSVLLFFGWVFNSTAQKTDAAFTKGSSVISLGHGIGNIWKRFLNDAVSNIPSISYKVSSTGPFTLIYEYGFFKRISAGAALSYSKVKGVYSWSGDTIEDELTIFTAMVRANYHFGKSQKFDPYLGGGLGYVHSKYSTDQSASRNSVPGLFGVSAQLGIHYYIIPHLSAYAEAGYVNGSFGQLGISCKF